MGYGYQNCGFSTTGIIGITDFSNLSSDERFSFSCYVYSTSGNSITAVIKEKNGNVVNESSSYNITHGGNGWEYISVTHIITDSTSTYLEYGISTGLSLAYIDNTMFTRGEPRNWYIENTEDGVSGIVNEKQAVSSTYEYIGIESSDVSYVHPWAIIMEGDSIINELKSIRDSVGGLYLCISGSNILNMPSAFSEWYGLISNGSISDINTVSKKNSDIINKMNIGGVHIKKSTSLSVVWEMITSQVENEATHTDEHYRYDLQPAIISDKHTWPPRSVSPDGYEAKYDDMEPNNSISSHSSPGGIIK
jgi:hypothetical protein